MAVGITITMGAAGTTEAITRMAYMRDTDRPTRGIGAIAASDHAGRSRRVLQAQISQRTRQRDRVMAAIAQGALGVLHSEGRDTTTGTTTSTVSQPGGYVSPGPVPVAPPVVVSPPVISPPVISPPVDQPPEVVVLPKPPIRQMPPIYPGPPGGVVLTTVPVPQLPMPGQATLEEPSSVGHTTRNLLLVGGAAIAAYFLFFRKKRSP